MSGGSRMRHSKWENKDSDDIYDRAPPRRPRESFSPGRGSRRNDNRSRESTMTLERERNCTRSPVREDLRVRHSSQSPRDTWGRSDRISRSRSPSQSPARNFQRETEINDRSNIKSGPSGTICRNFVAGRCKRGHNCHFLHEDSQLYDSRRSLEGSPPDDWDGNAMRAKKSAHTCNDFLKGRCRRGDTCQFMHHDSDFDVFEKGQGEHRYRDRSRDTNRDHDHRSRDTYRDHDHRSWDTYSDCDHRRKDMYTDRNHQSESRRSGETPPCKYFASGNCRNGSRCRFSHQVQQAFSPERRSRDDNRDTDRKFEGIRGWDGPGWDDVTTVSAFPTVPGWENDKSENKEDGKGRDRKNEGDKVWDGPGWDDMTTVSAVPTVPGWEGDKSEMKEDGKGLDRKNERDPVWNGPSWNDNNETREVAKDSWSHDMLIKPTWDQPATVTDKTQVQEKEGPLQSKTESNILKGEDIFSGDMEISPRDVKKESIFDSSTSLTLSSSNTCFPDHHTDLFGEKNCSYKDNNKPVLYSGERRDVVGDHNDLSIIQNQATTVPQVQGIFRSDKTVNVHPIPEISPPSQSLTPVLLHAPQGEGIQEVGGGPHGNVKNEQLAQLSHLTASLTQLLENRQQLPHLSSSVSSRDMPNLPIPNLATQPSQVLKQYDNASSRIEQKNAINEIRNEGYNSDPQEHLKQSKEENCKNITGFKAGENGPSQDVGPDKDLKGGVRPFKFALVEFVKELLKPSWKDGQVSKEAYKTIVKKVVDKVMETLGSKIPQTNEKIDLYLTCSKPKIDKLVQAYVGKHQKELI